ncbi:ABC transporter ATP-binding protein/permease [Chloroflexi bacterium TSY]|nr:ABC transporter ATP-binding protein/permease [Chloroflexi bacterium TSY]
MEGNGTNGTKFQHTIENKTDAPLDWAQALEQAKEDRAKIDQAKLIDEPGELALESSQKISQDWALFRLLGESLWPYKGWMLAALFLMIIVATLNVIPPLLLQWAIDGPLAQAINNPQGSGFNGLLAQSTESGLLGIAALYALTAIGIYGITYAYTYFLQQAGQRALADLRVRLFNHLLNHDYAFLSQTSTGELVARLTNDIDQLNAVLSSSVVVVLVEGATLIAVVTMMFAINWRLALLALAILPVVLVVTVYFRARLRRSSTGERSAMARISSFLNEHLHGMTVVQLFNRESESEEEFDTYNSRYRRALILVRKHSAVFLSVQEILASIGLALMLYAGGLGVLAGWATLGVLVAFIQYTQRAFRPVIMLSQQYNAVQIALGAAERIYRMLNTEPNIQNPQRPTSLTNLSGSIQLEDVHFRYVEDEPVLRGVSLDIPAGQSVAIVGATGAGKSSLVSLLARQYDPQKGAVKLDEIDIRELNLADLRRSVAVVPQDPVCLAGSIERNIRLYRNDVSEEEIRKAAEFTNAAQFIDELPGRYDFEVLPGGANLSQGQRQLLALARALALSPNGVLVLDEATSSIDTATEALIQDALERVLRTRTSLVIAHRLSTIRNADRIIVMDKGKVVEDGEHDSLLALNGFYARLHEHQVMPEMVAV